MLGTLFNKTLSTRVIGIKSLGAANSARTQVNAQQILSRKIHGFASSAGSFLAVERQNEHFKEVNSVNNIKNYKVSHKVHDQELGAVERNMRDNYYDFERSEQEVDTEGPIPTDYSRGQLETMDSEASKHFIETWRDLDIDENLEKTLPTLATAKSLSDVKITKKFIKALEGYKHRAIPERYAVIVMLKALKYLQSLPSLVHITVPKDQKITVVGDTHGQYSDTLLALFKQNGSPTATNLYLFNGDYVDRGHRGSNIVIHLLAQMLNNGTVFLNRGNHEDHYCNDGYGFTNEVTDPMLYKLFQEVFNSLPLASVINKKVFVVHGGLIAKKNVKLSDIETIPRFRGVIRDEKDLNNDSLQQLLWNDPMESEGASVNSRRGGTYKFGSDVTKNFLETNNLDLIVRSHEVVNAGYCYQQNDMLITVFSSPFYAGRYNNKGGFLVLTNKDPDCPMEQQPCVIE